MLSFFQLAHYTLGQRPRWRGTLFPHEGAQCEHDRALARNACKKSLKQTSRCFLICSTVLEAESSSTLPYDGEISSASTTGRKKECYYVRPCFQSGVRRFTMAFTFVLFAVHWERMCCLSVPVIWSSSVFYNLRPNHRNFYCTMNDKLIHTLY
jgi:hypothetical protein